jgi:hypothetical protein
VANPLPVSSQAGYIGATASCANSRNLICRRSVVP